MTRLPPSTMDPERRLASARKTRLALYRIGVILGMPPNLVELVAAAKRDTGAAGPVEQPLGLDWHWLYARAVAGGLEGFVASTAWVLQQVRERADARQAFTVRVSELAATHERVLQVLQDLRTRDGAEQP